MAREREDGQPERLVQVKFSLIGTSRHLLPFYGFWCFKYDKGASASMSTTWWLKGRSPKVEPEGPRATFASGNPFAGQLVATLAECAKRQTHTPPNNYSGFISTTIVKSHKFYRRSMYVLSSSSSCRRSSKWLQLHMLVFTYKCVCVFRDGLGSGKENV